MIEVRDINIQNQEFLDALDEYKDTLLARDEDGRPLIDKAIKIHHQEEDADKWVSDEYMKSIISMGSQHDGFPVILKGYSGLKHEQGSQHNNKHATEVYDATSRLNTKIMQMLGARNNALNACYPPGGFISWHNNANAPGYNIIITYSETGEGWFDYWDIDKKERVRIQDKPGWQAKMTYFGPYSDPDNLCYHAAYTDCLRITVAFVFAEEDEWWEEVIEDLENPV